MSQEIRLNILFAVSGAIAAGSVYASAKTGDWMWFARCGSWIVLLGAYHAWYDFRKYREEISTRAREQFKSSRATTDRILAEIEAQLRRTEPAEQQDALIVQLREIGPKIIDDVYAEASPKLEKRLREAEAIHVAYRKHAEVFLIVAGTVIWAYGDIVGKVVYDLTVGRLGS